MAKNKELNLYKVGVSENIYDGTPGDGIGDGSGSGTGGLNNGNPNIGSNWREVENLSQSHHFTVQIDGINVNYTLPGQNTFGTFLPVQNVSFSFVNFNSMNLPVGIYGNLPILKSKSVCKVSLSIYDNDRDEVEAAIRKWEQQCFPNDMYVGYLSEITRTLIYTSFGVTGKPNKYLSIDVIPADNYSITRGYEDNAPKLITLNLVTVGSGLFKEY